MNDQAVAPAIEQPNVEALRALVLVPLATRQPALAAVLRLLFDNVDQGAISAAKVAEVLGYAPDAQSQGLLRKRILRLREYLEEWFEDETGGRDENWIVGIARDQGAGYRLEFRERQLDKFGTGSTRAGRSSPARLGDTFSDEFWAPYVKAGRRNVLVYLVPAPYADPSVRADNRDSLKSAGNTFLSGPSGLFDRYVPEGIVSAINALSSFFCGRRIPLQVRSSLDEPSFRADSNYIFLASASHCEREIGRIERDLPLTTHRGAVHLSSDQGSFLRRFEDTNLGGRGRIFGTLTRCENPFGGIATLLAASHSSAIATVAEILTSAHPPEGFEEKARGLQGIPRHFQALFQVDQYHDLNSSVCGLKTLELITQV
jgi:hypothetical protein